MPDDATPKPDLAVRVAQLEAELARVKHERDMYKESIYAQHRGENDPYTPPTAEELHDLLHGPRGEALIDIVAEFERKLAMP